MVREQPSPGDEICAVGARSQHVTRGCIAHVVGQNIYGDKRGLIDGDSGGPAWIPGRGYVGSLSGWSNHAGYTWGSFQKFVHPSAR